jgi:ectoine hydroxylase-related dioxygenase (phytanoyl-CoA dioxygenase family)
MQLTAADRTQLTEEGFVLVRGVLDSATVDRLRVSVSHISNGHEHNRRTYAARNLLQIPAIADLARSESVLALLRQLVVSAPGRQAIHPMWAVRGLLFNKVAEANWAVPWHQDLTIAVRERLDAPGFGPWSVKDGVVHVQPPDEVIARMLALRFHLDDTDGDNGALRVIPGSHHHGRLTPAAIARWTIFRKPVTIEAPAGSVLLMRPHLLHASSPATTPKERRVIHIEYSPDSLPCGLEWNEAVC